MSISPLEARTTDRFRNLLTSLARLVSLEFVISDGKNSLFGTEEGRRDNLFGKSIGAISTHILRENAPTQDLSGGALPVYGAPVIASDEPIGVILGYERKAPGLEQPGGEKIENILGSLAEVIGERSSAEREWDSTVEQLSQSFEIMSLYSRLTPLITSVGLSEEMLSGLVTELLETTASDCVFGVFDKGREHSVCATRPGSIPCP